MGILAQKQIVCTLPLDTFQTNRAKRDELRELSGKLLTNERVHRCGKVPAPAGAELHWRGTHASYHGLMRCGNVWTCPNCGATIAQRRSVEINAAISYATQKKMHISMLTLTASHTRGDKLKPLLDKLNKAIRSMYNGRQWQALASELGYVGSIRNAEATWGEATGWHPHSHIILLTENELTERLDTKLFTRWQEACNKVGLETSFSAWKTTRHSYLEEVKEEAIELDGLIQYVAKMGRQWTMGDELTKWHRKNGKQQQRYSPAALLNAINEGETQLTPIYKEYGEAYKGRRQLFWSHGLRNKLGMTKEQNDAEVLQESSKGDVIHAFTREEWQLVTKYNYRMIMLELVEYVSPEERPEAVRRELALLAEKYQPKRDQVDFTVDLRLLQKAFTKLFRETRREWQQKPKKQGFSYLPHNAFFDDIPPSRQLTAKERRRLRGAYD